MKINNLNIQSNKSGFKFETIDTLKTIENQNEDKVSKETSFNEVILDNIFSTVDSQIKELLRKIENQKEKLIKDTSLIEFRRYKSLISEFIQIINNKSKLKEQLFFDNVGRQKVLKNIDKIDIKLRELQNEFIKDNKNDIKVINLVDEVKGLLVDTIV